MIPKYLAIQRSLILTSARIITPHMYKKGYSVQNVERTQERVLCTSQYHTITISLAWDGSLNLSDSQTLT